MWRNDDLYVALWVSAHPASPEPPDPFDAARAGKRAATVLPAAPLMHGTGLFAALGALAGRRKRPSVTVCRTRKRAPRLRSTTS